MPKIRANGVELFYELSGPDGAPVIAFSNSLGTRLEMWDAQERALSGEFRCLRYDTRGHGRSETTPPGFSVDDLAEDLNGLLDGLGIARAHVVGLSLGGMTGQALAVLHPEKVDRLVLVATAAYLPPETLWQERAEIVRAKGMAALADNVIQRWFTPPEQASQGALATRRILLESIDPQGYANCCLAIGRMDLRPRIGSIRAPTLVVSGAQDPATPVAMGEEIASLVPGAEFAVVPDAAHLIAVERAEALTAHIARFLRGGMAGEREPMPVPGDRQGDFEAGLENRKTVLGAEHVERSLRNAGAFAGPWQDFITRYAWGEIWGDDTLPWKTRSMIVLSLTLALGKEEEFKLHLRPALRNGVTVEELRALLKQCAVYAGVPAANGAFRWAREVLGEELG
ncbi:3-oxoadipate enol-lactonase [Enterovirga aerilata]|uniref:3-oxoadipate enol-lactonase n=1 Tax=Enterovirga aerilata TaxID=2730920 RepID=A0A849I5V7_9HYPH|nr:3-oxoadipate enol-lactonase [Enterovirga sp. DB1703]NNM71715.1 3-oxoadipate enol-lactonase [Enterovirga sp. DB1703]